MKHIVEKVLQTLFSRMTLLTVLIPWILMIFALLIRDGHWNSQIHPYYEPLLLNILLVLNLPAIAVSERLTTPPSFTEGYQAKDIVIFIAFISIQWLIIGCIIKFLRDFLRNGNSGIK